MNVMVVCRLLYKGWIRFWWRGVTVWLWRITSWISIFDWLWWITEKTSSNVKIWRKYDASSKGVTFTQMTNLNILSWFPLSILLSLVNFLHTPHLHTHYIFQIPDLKTKQARWMEMLQYLNIPICRIPLQFWSLKWCKIFSPSWKIRQGAGVGDFW